MDQSGGPVGFTSVQEILKLTGGRLANPEEFQGQMRVDQIFVNRPVSLKGSCANEVAFFFSRAFQNELPFANPGVLITGDAFVDPLRSAGLPLWKKTAVVACADPYLALAVLTEHFAPQLSTV